MKSCICCGKLKPLTAYHKHPRMKDGRLNKCAECVLQNVREWREKNPGCRHREYLSKKEDYVIRATKRQALKKTASMKWDCELTDFAFSEARRLTGLRKKATGIEWHVDHVVPLKGVNVCGLHVWNNFSVIPAVLNLRKSNSFKDV